MISVHIMYPNTDESTFDMDYYTATHMPMLADAIGEACLAWGATSVQSGGSWAAIGWCRVESHDAFNSAMAEHGAKIMGDIPNYTNVSPELIIGDVTAH